MFCDRCGTAVDANMPVCPQCGTAQPVGGPPGASPRGAGDWIVAGWNAVTSNFWVFVLLGLIYVAASSVLPILLQGPIAMGLQWAALRQVAGRRATLDDLSIGFEIGGTAILICFIVTLISVMAYAVFLIPGIFVSALLHFPYLVVLDRRARGWDAIGIAMQCSQGHYLKLLLLTVLQGCLLIGGLLLCGAGLLVAVPIVFASTAAAYIDLCGLEASTRARIG